MNMIKIPTLNEDTLPIRKYVLPGAHTCHNISHPY